MASCGQEAICACNTQAPQGRTPAQGELRADQLDLAALAQIGSRLPLGPAAHSALQTYTPEGLVNDVYAHGAARSTHCSNIRCVARCRALALAGRDRDAGNTVPGLRGANVDIDMTHSGGKASLAIASGALVLPGVFEDPVLPLDQLSAEMRWQVDGERISVNASNVRFANADAQGELRASWHTSDARQAPGFSLFPGVMDLSGTLSRADGTRVHRYLPLSIPVDSRHYVRDAIQTGSASNVQFRVKGDLHDIPFNDPRQGEFRIAATRQGRDVRLRPSPRLQPADALPWPALTQLGGELIFERSSMQVRGATGSFAGTPGVRLAKVEAQIPDLGHTVVAGHADARGPLPNC